MIKASIGTLVITSMIATTTLRAEVPQEVLVQEETVATPSDAGHEEAIISEQPAPEARGYPEYSEEKVLEQQNIDQNSEESVIDEWDEFAEEPPEAPPTKVGKPQDTGYTPAQKKVFYNSLLATCAIVVAVVAIVLASSNNGHNNKCPTDN